MLADRSTSDRCLDAHLEFAGLEFLHTLIVSHDQNEIDFLATKLRSPTPAGDVERSSSAPSLCRPACGEALSVFRAYQHCHLHSRGKNGDTFGVLQNVQGTVSLVVVAHDC